jgi:hypothetical protein
MPDYHNPDDPFYQTSDDPLRRDVGFNPDSGPTNVVWGWVAAALFMVVILTVAFGIGHQPGQTGTNTASNEVTPPAASRMAPPVTTTVPVTPAPPISPAPNTPAQR